MKLFDFLFGKKQDNNSSKTTPSTDGNKVNPRSAGDERLLEPIEILPGLIMPKAFEPYRDTIAKTRLDYISIKATPKAAPALEESKFGHYPYMPADFDYPKDTEGQYMYLLAQLNFAEMPKLPGYPESGYLQFYISAYDDLHGLNFDDAFAQKNFRVLFFEEADVVQYKADFSFLDEVMNQDLLPINKTLALSFTTAQEYMGMHDIRTIGNKEFNSTTVSSQHPAIEDELEESLFDNCSANGHKVGGYAYFTQVDPREGATAKMLLLLQIDSDDDNIMWGDCGVANFFIYPEDLAKKDFSKVMYNWDCS